MARHADPAELARLKGADKANPSRIPTNVPKSEQPLGEPPDHIQKDEVAAKFWADTVLASPKGVLTGADREMLTIACELVSARRKYGIGGENGVPIAVVNATISILARFGLSPSDRRSLGTNEPPAGANAFDKF
jgi:hypothetical protein